jgi:transglutaminase-like putative cysteine protease
MPNDSEQTFGPASAIDGPTTDAAIPDPALFRQERAESPAQESPASPERTAIARSRVTVAPPPEWVNFHRLEPADAPANDGACWILLHDEQVRTSEHAHYRRRAQRLATFDAVSEAGKWQLAFDPATQSVVIHTIRILRGDACLEQANVTKLQFLQREQGLTSSAVIDGWVTMLLPLEDVRVGDILETAHTVTSSPRLFADRYSARWPAALPFPTKKLLLTVRFPAATEMRWKADPADLAPAIREVGEETEWSWQWRNVSGIENEPNMPWWYLPPGWVQVSSFVSWAEIVNGLRAAWERQFDYSELDDAARRLAAEATSPADCLERAFKLVQDDIRYLSVNLELGGHIPADPATTLRRRFGDCKDKSFLLADLLRRLGYSARPVLVHTQLDRALEKFLPSLFLFNHAIAEFEFEGKRRWIDTTVDQQGGGPLSRVNPRLSLGLPIGPGVTALEFLPTSPNIDTPSYYGLSETFRLSSSIQPVCVRSVVTARGSEADSLRRRLHHRGVHSIAREREQWYGAIFGGVKRISALEVNDDREKNELVMAEAFDLPNAMRAFPNHQFVFEQRPHVLRNILSTPTSTGGRRRAPFALDFPLRVEHTIELEWSILQAAKGRRVRERNPYFRLWLEETRNMGKWISRYDLETLADSTSAEALPRFEKLIAGVAQALYVGVIGPAGTLASAKRFSGSLLPMSRHAAKKNGPSRPRYPMAPEPVAAAVVGVPLPEQPAEPLLTAPAAPPPPVDGPGILRGKQGEPIYKDHFVRPTEKRSSSKSSRHRRARMPWPIGVKVTLWFILVVGGSIALLMCAHYAFAPAHL